MMELAFWEPDSGSLLPSSARTPATISGYAVQLSNKDKRQIVGALESGHYEMGINYLWNITATALRKELSIVGVELLGEMLGRADVSEHDDVEDILTTSDAIRLAEELGVVSPTDAMRLRHVNELVVHFSNLEMSDADIEDIDETEAIASLKACVKGVLGRPKVEVARKFVEFRAALESESLRADDPRVDMLRSSPYFFIKLTVSVLMNAVKRTQGAMLEHTLANINMLIPDVWDRMRDAEKWQVGQSYAEAYADGKKAVVSGLRTALLKIRGFDYVPENLRSNTFLKSANQIIIAHEGMNNFYNEAAPVRNLLKLGSTIPTPALPACMSALMCVVLGNSYGTAWAAVQDANRLLESISSDRWSYYINKVLASDLRIINKFLVEKPRQNWIEVAQKYDFATIQILDKSIGSLIRATLDQDDTRLVGAAKRLRKNYYTKHQ